jgi:hypothetical protein
MAELLSLRQLCFPAPQFLRRLAHS